MHRFFPIVIGWMLGGVAGIVVIVALVVHVAC
jgi:hypothetical protein